jgi:NAD-dependent SIR2 family protein deacetylase
VRRPFIVGTAAKKWKATLSHFFLAVLHEKRMLRRVYTQNIDGLDFQIGTTSITVATYIYCAVETRNGPYLSH